MEMLPVGCVTEESFRVIDTKPTEFRESAGGEGTWEGWCIQDRLAPEPTDPGQEKAISRGPMSC